VSGEPNEAASLERARPEDVPVLVGLGQEAPRPPSASGLEQERGAGRLWVLRTRQGLVAWCSVRFVADELQIEDLAVAPGCRGQGWGRRLLAVLLELARRRGAATAHLEVRRGNAPARGLYRSAGFAEVGRRRDYYQGPREDAVLMRRQLLAGSGDDC
jgi:ribosomal-protein-alanine N-acetyltransferase